MTQQSIVTENANTSFHHDDINRQAHHDNLNKALGNQENQQSNTSRYCTNITAAREGSDDWIWKHFFKLDNFSVRCNNYRLKWENDNNLKWQYVDKVDLYKGKCKFCKYICHGAYMYRVNSHLRKEHSQEIRAIVQKKIANKSLSQYFEVDEEKFIAWCKCCNVKLDIFYGTDALIRHFCVKNKSLRSPQEPEDNDVNRMTQQSIVTENANTNFHHDDINRQAPQNQDQQSDYTTSVFYSNTGINDLRFHCQHHINENSRYEKGAADNNEYRMMQQEAAENMATRYHHESIYWHDFKNQEGQQR
ncbi:PREDICTED: uncharacterized protein LOC105152795 [Acromyrmex echinatior]|uniref:uncharacterized protein LOC105152795 n=1 Tax=Acromyrmex echinatior TaxID=103372 RepID=UPI000580BC4B|nr:PREDICTED: uncharacterized protein LOC105152795 [Acromyrmex echinatior]